MKKDDTLNFPATAAEVDWMDELRVLMAKASLKYDARHIIAELCREGKTPEQALNELKPKPQNK